MPSFLQRLFPFSIATGLRWLGGLLVAGIILAVVFSKNQPENIDALTLEKKDMLATLTVTGEVRADASAVIGAPVSAQVMQLFVDEGDTVQQNQPLAQLEQRTTSAQLAEATANVKTAAAGLEDLTLWKRQEEREQLKARLSESKALEAQADTQLKAARIQQKWDEDTLSRNEALYRGEFISKQELDAFSVKAQTSQEKTKNAEAQKQQAHAQTIDAEEALKTAQNGPTRPALKKAQATVESARQAASVARELYNQRTLLSPLSGVVTARYHEPGDMVTTGEKILVIALPESLEVIGYVEEADIASIQKNNTAYVVLDAYPNQPLKAAVKKIGSRVNPDNGTIEVTLRFLPEALKTAKLLPGMTCDVNILTAQLHQVMVIPATSVREENGKQQVYRFQGGRLSPVSVRLKKVSAEYFEVLSGLAAGERIAKVARPGDLAKKRVQPK